MSTRTSSLPVILDDFLLAYDAAVSPTLQLFSAVEAQARQVYDAVVSDARAAYCVVKDSAEADFKASVERAHNFREAAYHASWLEYQDSLRPSAEAWDMGIYPTQLELQKAISPLVDLWDGSSRAITARCETAIADARAIRDQAQAAAMVTFRAVVLPAFQTYQASILSVGSDYQAARAPAVAALEAAQAAAQIEDD